MPCLYANNFAPRYSLHRTLNSRRPFLSLNFWQEGHFYTPGFLYAIFSFWYWRTRKMFSLSRNSKQRLLLRIPQFTFLLLWQTFTRSTSTLMKSSTSRELFLLPAKSPFTINGEYKNTTVTDVYDWKPLEINMTGGMDAPNRCHSFFNLVSLVSINEFPTIIELLWLKDSFLRILWETVETKHSTKTFH